MINKRPQCKGVAVWANRRCKHKSLYGEEYCHYHMPDEDGNTSIQKDSEYEYFILWHSIPAIVRRIYTQPADSKGKTGQDKLINLGYDIENPIFQTLMDINTQRDFSKVFNVHEDTLSEWKKRKGFHERVKKEMLSSHVLRFEKEIDFKFTQNALKRADANTVKTWKQIYAGFTDRLEHSGIPAPGDGTNIIKLLNEKDPKSGRKLGEILRDIHDEKKNDKRGS